MTDLPSLWAVGRHWAWAWMRCGASPPSLQVRKLPLNLKQTIFKSANTKCLIAPLKTMMASKSYMIFNAITFHTLKVRRKIYHNPWFSSVHIVDSCYCFGAINLLIQQAYHHNFYQYYNGDQNHCCFFQNTISINLVRSTLKKKMLDTTASNSFL